MSDNVTAIVTEDDIDELLVKFSQKTYYATDDTPETSNIALRKCFKLFEADYNVITIDNTGGVLCGHYPSQLALLQQERHPILPMSGQPASQTRAPNTIYEDTLEDKEKIETLINSGRFARCRTRFPFPVILFKGKYLCRSATLSGGPEIYGRTGLEYISKTVRMEEYVESSMVEDELDDGEDSPSLSQTDWQLFTKVRQSDIKLLRVFNIGTIVDFMVEKKKVKYGLNVSSSEKVDKENRYLDFNLISLPYPGCEFFKDYRDNNYEASQLRFNWGQSYVDATISVPADPLVEQLSIDWSTYREWDLERITLNYLKLILKYLNDGNSGVLVHCISGWDRTPLFVSLVRLSLWADGLIHQNLDMLQIIYLTIGYDWMLFGHRLPDRINKGEDIFFFCFNILKKIVGDEFSLVALPKPRVNVEYAFAHDNGTEPFWYDNRYKAGRPGSACSGQEYHNLLAPPTGDEANNANGNGHSNSNSPPYQNDCGYGLNKSPTKRTSPVLVPGPRLRQRHESTSSGSSWHMVTGSGSIRESESDSNGFNANSDTSSNPNLSQNFEDYEENTRKYRLMSVRKLYLNAYHRKVGLNFRNEMTFAKLLGSFAEVVGLVIKN